MNLEKLLQMQKVLDERIIKEKGLECQDLTLNTVNALIVELSEFANEGRWFKHWSNNQRPRIEIYVDCRACSGTGDANYEMVQEDAEGSGGHEYINCEECEGSGSEGPKNPLLEEYVDGLHFFLSLANQKGWQNSLYIYEDAIDDIRNEGFKDGLTGAFLETNYWLLKAFMEIDRDEKLERTLGITKQEFCFKSAWFMFLAIGLVGFNLTFEQIAEAYREKNKVNHQRQESGY
ncbi:dUTP diphosphatase [Schinkia azotoformans]|uniref:dUTP diphosphatase n=1 Tax=Schinkia azotoformans TaxID=1454 RepID=UPI002DBAAAD7|nr:dUTP diphosphatase [Schinkia azotoformans]MEC1714722.1 dUTP diphosphatase [Schinkia azotoformans]MEC1757522.1 dUTP diphosphatase [Schinkia azotoformans]